MASLPSAQSSAVYSMETALGITPIDPNVVAQYQNVSVAPWDLSSYKAGFINFLQNTFGSILPAGFDYENGWPLFPTLAIGLYIMLRNPKKTSRRGRR